jgi:hypothetical protein
LRQRLLQAALAVHQDRTLREVVERLGLTAPLRQPGLQVLMEIRPVAATVVAVAARLSRQQLTAAMGGMAALVAAVAAVAASEITPGSAGMVGSEVGACAL